MNMPIAIVTGSYGYIGTVLTKLLIENNYYVIGIDRDQKADSSWIDEGPRTKYCHEFLSSDFTSPEALHVLSEHPNATIFHLAADSLLGPSAYLPLNYFENNTAKTLKLLQNLKATHRLIFASTAAVYAPQFKPVSESDQKLPPNNYGKSKLWCEEMIEASYKTKAFKAVAFRFFNVIGAYGDVGQQDNTPHIINKLCDKALIEDAPFVITGDNHETNDGTCVRDYVHVIDICRAMIHADKYIQPYDGPVFFKYNLGTKYGRSVKEIVTLFNHLCKKVDFRIGLKREGDPPFLVANPEKFINETGFEYKYKHSDIDLMILDHWEYRKNGN